MHCVRCLLDLIQLVIVYISSSIANSVTVVFANTVVYLMTNISLKAFTRSSIIS